MKEGQKGKKSDFLICTFKLTKLLLKIQIQMIS